MTASSDQAPLAPSGPAAAASPPVQRPSESPAELLKAEFELAAENELLSEFDRSSPPAPVQPGQAPGRTPPPPERVALEGRELSFAERLLQRVNEREQRFKDARSPRQQAEQPPSADPKLQEQLNELRDWKAQVEAEREAQRDRAEAEAVYSRGSEIVRDVAPHLPEDYARAWLLNEALTNPNLSAAWEARHDSPEAARAAERAVDRAFTRLHKHLASLPEPSLTADRAMVASAVRGASGQAPRERPPSYSTMSDADFNHLTAKYGIKPL